MGEMAMHCGTPLVPTMKFSKAEYYCRECGETFGMFDGFERTPVTPELSAAMEENIAWFRDASKDLIARGMRRRDCAQCEAGEYHSEHCGDEAIRRSDEAYRRLLKQS